MTVTQSIRVAIVDDHAIVRRGLRNLLMKRDLDVVGEAECGDKAIQLAQQELPDVMLLDIRMKECDGLTALPQIRDVSPNTKVIILTTYSNPTYFTEAIRNGAAGFLLKDAEPDEIIQAIYTAASQHHLFNPELLSKVVQIYDDAQQPADIDNTETPSQISSSDTLDMTMRNYTVNEQLKSKFSDIISEREHDVLQLMAQGLSNAMIADKLQVSITTVKTHVTHILRKLNVSDRTQAVVVAMRHGLVH